MTAACVFTKLGALKYFGFPTLHEFQTRDLRDLIFFQTRHQKKKSFAPGPCDDAGWWSLWRCEGADTGMDVGGGELWNGTIGNRDVYEWWTSRIHIKHKGPLWYMRCDYCYELFYCNISCVWKIYGKNDCNLQSHECYLQRQVWLQVTKLFLAWNRREAQPCHVYDGSLHPSKLFCSHRKSSNSCTVSWYFQWTFFKKQEQTLKLWKHPIVHHLRSKHLKTLI